jgi:uncharacterized membrane protein
MRYLIGGLAALILSGSSFAQEPTYWQVMGVAADDTLNVRAEPNASADIVMEFAPGAGPIEVIEVRDGWAGVSTDRAEWGMGWVSTAYLERVEPAEWMSGVPAGLQCGGTEPFWGVSQSDDGLELDAFWRTPEMQSLEVTGSGRAHSIGYPAVLELDEGVATALFEPRACSDGMSDITYGWSLVLILRGESGDPSILSGCCRIPLPE